MVPRYRRHRDGRKWSAENRYRIWFEIEALAAEAMAHAGAIPESAARMIREKGGPKLAAIGPADIERIDAIERETRHDVIAFTTWLAEAIGAGQPLRASRHEPVRMSIPTGADTGPAPCGAVAWSFFQSMVPSLPTIGGDGYRPYRRCRGYGWSGCAPSSDGRRLPRLRPCWRGRYRIRSSARCGSVPESCGGARRWTSSLGMFSSRISTPSWRAKRLSSSSAEKAASNLRISNSSPPTPICWMKYLKGICLGDFERALDLFHHRQRLTSPVR